MLTSLIRGRCLGGLLGAGAFCVALLVTQRARAGGPLGPNGAPITTSDFALDVFTGPVLGGSRNTGLAGAYSAIAEGTDGNLVNPAAPAVRPYYSLDYFDYWLAFDFTLPVLSEMDFFNTGELDPDQQSSHSFAFLTPAINLQFGTFGVGLTLEYQRIAVDAPTKSGELLTSVTTSHLQFANGFFEGQLVAGLGARAVNLRTSDRSCEGQAVTCSVNELRVDESSFSSTGVGTEFGVLIKPNNHPFRVGASYRTAIKSTPTYSEEFLPNAEGDLVITGEGGSFYLPRRVELPWDVNLGFAYQFGRPFNPTWRTAQDIAEKELLQLRLAAIELAEQRDTALANARDANERAAIEQRYAGQMERNATLANIALVKARKQQQRELADWDRFYVLVSTSLTISGPVDSAVGIESYVNQKVARSGAKTTFAPHFALETEAIPDHLKLRTGCYFEPARSDGTTQRGHFTFGGDIRMGRFDVFGLWPADYLWALGTFADVAPRYVTFGVSLIGWYPRHSKKD